MCKRRSRQIKCIGTYIKSIVALYLEFYLFLVVAKLHNTNIMSFYRSKMFLDRPKCFWTVQNVFGPSKLFLDHLMPCPFTGPKIFWAGPNFLCHTKNLFTFCWIHKHFVRDKTMICIQ